MNKKLVWGIIAIAIIIVIILVSKKPPSQAPGSNEPIKIGADLSLTGLASQDGESIKSGLELARADLEAKGVNVEVIYQDDKTEPKTTVSAIQALNLQKVQAIIGPTWSYLGDAGVPIADQLKIVTIQPANTSEYVSARSPYSFFTVVKVARLVDPLTAWFKQSDKKRVAIIRNQGSWYEVVEKAVEDAAKNAGVQVVYKESLEFGTADSSMATIMTKVKAAKPDLIFNEMDDDKGVTSFFNKTNQLGIVADVMSVTTALGRQITNGNAHLSTGASLYIAVPKTSDAFNAKYQAAYSTPAQPYADRAYDSLMLLVDAIQNRGETPLNTYLSTKTDYQGYLGQYKFDQNGDISGGEWVVNKLK